MKRVQKNIKIYAKLIAIAGLTISINSETAKAQKNVGIGTETPNPSAILDLDVSNDAIYSANKLGFLAPRISESQKNSIPSPAIGLLIYQTDGQKGFYFYNGSAWARVLESETGMFLPLSGGVMSGAVNMGGKTITNIGANGTNFNLSGGLDLSDKLTISGGGAEIAGGMTVGGVVKLTSLSNNSIVTTNGSGELVSGKVELSSQIDGVVPIANGGSGIATIPANNQLLIGNGASYDLKTLSAGDNIQIDASGANITISAAALESKLTFSAPLSRTGNAISILPANSGRDGYITSADWQTFNSKENAFGAGTNTQYLRGDKTWAEFPTGFPPSGGAGGDLSGSYPNPTVSAIQGRVIDNSAPTDGQILAWSGANSRWQVSDQKPGTVSSVGLLLPDFFDVQNSPVTTSGIIQAGLVEKNANSVLISPADGSLGTPSFRSLTDADIPNNITIDGMLKGAGAQYKLAVYSASEALTSYTNLTYLNNNLGVGSAAPSQRLEVSDGNILISNSAGAIDNFGISLMEAAANGSNTITIKAPKNLVADNVYTLPNAYPSADAVLKSDVNGNLSWGAISGMPTGTSGQTLRYDASGNLLPSSLVINDGTNIGINTASPINKLDLAGAMAIGASYAGVSAAPENGLLVQGKMIIGATALSNDSLYAEINGDLRINGDLIVTGNIDPTVLFMQAQPVAPTTTMPGAVYYDGVANKLKFFNGSSWEVVTSAPASVGGILPVTPSVATNKLLLVDTNLANNKHTEIVAANLNDDLKYTLPKSKGAHKDVLSTDSVGELQWTSILPAGMLIQYAGSVPPEGWLICDGRAVSRSEYSKLFAAIGSMYGAGDGSTTFNLPDMRGRMPLGADNMGGLAAGRVSMPEGSVIGASAGEEKHVLSANEMPQHNHTFNMHHANSFGRYVDIVAAGGTPILAVYSRTIGGTGTASQYNCVRDSMDPEFYKPLSNSAIANSGNGDAHNNMPPFVTMNFIIKY
jgi:microcystin-dependent protein